MVTHWKNSPAQMAAVKKAAEISAERRRAHGTETNDLHLKAGAIFDAMRVGGRGVPLTMNEITTRISENHGGSGMGPFQSGQEARHLVAALEQVGLIKSRWSKTEHSHVYSLANKPASK